MKLFTKITLVFGLFVLCLTYVSAQDIPLYPGTPGAGARLSCDQRTGFQDKITKIKNICIQKTAMLKKVDTSLKGIIPLVKNPAIKTKLQTKEKSVQSMGKNYTTLKARIEKNPKSICGGDPVWKTYNEETKLLVNDIRQQLRLLKK